MSAFLAIIFLCSSLYYDTTVTRSVQESMIASYVRGTGGYVSDFSDLTIYPKTFETLYRKRETQPPEQHDPSSWTKNMRSKMHGKFQRHNRDSIYSLLLPGDYDSKIELTKEPALDTLLLFGKSRQFEYVHEHVRKRHKEGLYETHIMEGRDLDIDEEIKAYENNPDIHRAGWGNVPGVPQKPRVISESNICHAFNHAKEIANFSTPHVLITHLNENWGGLSSETKGRTADWGTIVRGFYDAGCDPMEIKELYLDSPNTLAVFTTQHQSIFDHPKVHSIPLGIANSKDGGEKRIRLLQKQKAMVDAFSSNNRTGLIDHRPGLLMINNSPSATRLPVINAVIENFAKEGVKLVNSFSRKGNEKEQMSRFYRAMSHNKFILCPSGLGWDSYRIWEALMMGTIPVIEKHKHRYEVLTYPIDSGKRSKVIRLLEKGEEGGNLNDTRKSRTGRMLENFLTKEHLQSHNASIEIVEYFDGWRRTLDDLPVVWIDGEFSDVAPPGEESNKNYLTPQLLEREYDALAAKMETFRYEKLTSLYWIRFIESFLLLNDPSKALDDGPHGPHRFDSQSELETWKAAMESLSPIFNNHSILPIRKGRGWVGWRDDEEFETEAEDMDNGNTDEDGTLSSYLLGNQQPHVLSWILLIQIKLVGVAMLIVAWTKLTANSAQSSSVQPEMPE